MSGATTYDSGIDRGAAMTALLIADDPVATVHARDAMTLAGGRIVEQFGWGTDPQRIIDAAFVDVVLIEAAGIAAETLAAALPLIDAAAQTRGIMLVITLDAAQIDLVAASVFGAHAQLLCAPTLAERIAAILTARATGVTEKGNEAESERLRRLNDEVARIAETLARLTRRERDGALPERTSAVVADRAMAYAAPPSVTDTPFSAADIRQAIRSRRLRAQYFPAGLFEDPAWDMLLDLFAAELEGAQVSVSSLCIAAAVAPTTALRWIAKMSEAGLFERAPDPFDRRRAYMALSATAREGMQNYVAAVRRAGLSIS